MFRAWPPQDPFIHACDRRHSVTCPHRLETSWMQVWAHVLLLPGIQEFPGLHEGLNPAVVVFQWGVQ